MSPKTFDGKAVIVTGSSSGIGRATAGLFAASGAKVTLSGRNLEALESARSSLVKAGSKPDDVIIVQGDVADDAVASELVERTVAAFGRLDVLVNNAAALETGQGTAANMDVKHFDHIMRVNVRQVILLTQLAAPHLAKTHGAVVNVSSIVAQPHQFPNHPFYSITKAALDQVTVQMAAALIKQGIRVNSVNPGLILTELYVKNGMTEETSAKFFGRMNNSDIIPCGRHGEPEDAAKVILFLANRNESEWVVGQKIFVDGGSSMKNNLLHTIGAVEDELAKSA